jgi:hypothetical protein
MANNFMPDSDPGALPIHIHISLYLPFSKANLRHLNIVTWELLPNLFESGQKNVDKKSAVIICILLSLSGGCE